MKSACLFLVPLMLGCSAALSQRMFSQRMFSQRMIDVSYSLDRQGRYVFSCHNKDVCPYILHLDFTTLDNLHADHALPLETEVNPGTTQLLIVSPLDKSKDNKLNYRTSFRKGCMHPAVDVNFVYLLPTAPGLETQAYRIPNKPGSSPGGQDSGYSVRLRGRPGDTIYAARRGVVTVVDASSSDNDAGATSTNGWNFIEIYQADCSFAEYGIVQKDGAFVKPGQLVEAGTPIGLVGGDRYGRGAEVRFSVSYYPGVPNTQIPLIFWTKGNGKGPLRHGANYTSEFTKTLLTRERPRTPAKKAAAAGHRSHG